MDSPKARAARRAKAAKKLEVALDRLYARSFKIPSFTGKARFIDSIKPLHTMAINLAFDLEVDSRETP